MDLDALIREADPARGAVIPQADEADATRIVEHPAASGGRMADFFWGGIVAAITLAVALVILTAGGPRQVRITGEAAPRIPPAARPLVSILGVLRRPQTAADRAAAPYAAGGSDPSLVRLAAVTPWGERVTLAPYRSGAHEQLCIGFSYLPPTGAGSGRAANRLERAKARLERANARGHGGGDCGLTAALIEAGKAWSLEGAGREFAGGSTAVRLFIVVPDGVAKVAFVLPRQGSVPGGPVYRHSLSVLAPVHNNVAFARVNRQCCDGNLVTRWYAADGQLVKVTGKPAASNHISPTPKPTPETPLSRAAERNPSTPNPIHVLPSSGGPGTTFKVQWRLLLSDADYEISATGPNGAGCRGASDLHPIVGGGPNDVRGQLYGVTIPGGRGSNGWCPGTYQVSVTLYDLGLAGGLKHPDRPFGTAAFTIIG